MSKISKRVISAGIVPVRFSGGKPLFLLLGNKGYWDFPKGRQEDKENIFDTAIREVQEETTIKEDDLNFKWGKINKKSDVYKNNSKQAIYFIAETDMNKIELPINPEIGKAEHDSYIWATYEEALKLVGPRITKILKWANDVVSL